MSLFNSEQIKEEQLEEVKKAAKAVIKAKKEIKRLQAIVSTNMDAVREYTRNYGPSELTKSIEVYKKKKRPQLVGLESDKLEQMRVELPYQYVKHSIDVVKVLEKQETDGALRKVLDKFGAKAIQEHEFHVRRI